MPEWFEIEPITSRVYLDAELRAKAPYTVESIIEEKIIGRAFVGPLPPAQVSWFTIEGDTTRLFEERGSSEHYVVDVSVPADTAAGGYGFRLNMVDDDATDERVDQGPVVSFTVPQREPPPLPPQPKWLIWLAVAVGVIVIGLLTWLIVPLRGSGPGYALRFDTQDDVVRVTNLTGMEFAHPFTIEAWVRLSSLSAGGGSRGVLRGQAAGELFGLLLHWEEDPSWMSFVNTAETGVFLVTSPQSGYLETGEWQHLAGTYDGTTIRLYYNGKQIASESWSAGATAFDTPTDAEGALGSLVSPQAAINEVLIGRIFASPKPEIVIDEVRLWDHARRRGRIRSNMKRILTGSESGLIGYWKFDTNGSRTAIDSTSNANHGELGATPSPDSADPAWTVSKAPLWKKPFRLWTVLLAVGVLLLGGGGVAAYFLWLRPVVVPAVAGLTVEQATEFLTRSGLTVGEVSQEFNDTVGAGRVIESDPKAGTKVKRQSAVHLSVSKGPKPA